MIKDKFVLFVIALGAASIALISYLLVILTTNTVEGTVTDKYFDDADMVCSKGCVTQPDCWTIVVDSEPWYNETACVSESDYRDIKVGDYFKEDE